MKSKLENDYIFYEKYHKHPINKFIHVICIPAISWSLFVLLNNINYSYSIYNNLSCNQEETLLQCSLMIRPSFILYLLYTTYYLYLSHFLGIMSGIFYLIILFSANLFTCKIENTFNYAIVVQILGWISQIASHKFIEKNSPAFLDGFVQSFLTALYL